MRGFDERNDVNAPVQGSAADIIKVAMINIQDWMKTENLESKMLMQVHDELVFDASKKESDELIRLVRTEMESSMKLSVPIKVTVKTGPNWLETKEVL